MDKSVIRVHHLSYWYLGKNHPALSNISLVIPRGGWTVILGKNGSGKSTLIRIIDGLLHLQTGVVKVDNYLLKPSNLWQIRSRIGVIFQNPADQFIGATVKDDLTFSLENQQIPMNRINLIINRVLTQVKMLSLKNHLLRSLSGGQQQRVALAEMLAIRPQVIILDESTSMLDPLECLHILNLINQLRIHFHLTIVDVTHREEEIDYANWLVVLNRGHLVLNGSKNAVLAHPKILQRAGIVLPAIDRLKKLLIQRGVPLPSRHVSEEEMLICLRRLF